MGLERSEGFYAGLSLVPTNELKTTSESKFMSLYQVAMDNLEGDRVKDGAGNVTKTGLLKKCNVEGASVKDTKDIYNDLAGAISAVIGTRSGIQPKNQVPDAVYLTGNKWHSDIGDFKIEAFGMKDYNSSDTVLKYGNRYVGISLKKKLQLHHDSPTLINNAFSKFIQGQDKLIEKLDEHRIKFFAGLIKKACCSHKKDGLKNGKPDPEHPLASIVYTGDGTNIHKLNPDNYNDAKKIWNTRVVRIKPDGKEEPIPLINLKGTDELASGANGKLPLKTRNDFRNFINKNLQSHGGKLNPLYKGFLDIMNDPEVKETLAKALLNRTLKLSLYDELDTWQKSDFAFYLVEGVGNYTAKTGSVNVSSASVFEQGTIMTAVSSLASGPAEITLDRSKTFQGGGKRAKVFFKLFKNDYHLLNIELRYKGDFNAMPQFFATMTPEFKKLYSSQSITNAVKSMPH